MKNVSNTTREFLEFASGYGIDEVLEGASTLLAQAAMRRAGNLDEALAVHDLLASASRKAITENFATAR